MFGKKRRHLAPISHPGLLDLAFECHGQHPRLYEVIDEVQLLVYKNHMGPAFK